ncbi:MAG: hypothetical protein Q4F27_06795, partial [Desulfovibrionaceae bacterium]|nr:hypothetical protein [Desulfovibrionaceae bacterium]
YTLGSLKFSLDAENKTLTITDVNGEGTAQKSAYTFTFTDSTDFVGDTLNLYSSAPAEEKNLLAGIDLGSVVTALDGKEGPTSLTFTLADNKYSAKVGDVAPQG